MRDSHMLTDAPTWSGDTSLFSYVQQLPFGFGLERCISCYVVCFSKFHLHYLEKHRTAHKALSFIITESMFLVLRE